MFNLIASVLLKNKWTYIILVFLGIVYFAWNQYNKAQQLEFAKTELVQNQQAYQDSLQKARDSVQTTAIFVKNLNDENNKLKEFKGKYIILYNKYNLLVEAMADSGNGQTNVTDSVATVQFSGTKSIVSYKGKTEYNLFSRTSTWNLGLEFEPINIISQAYYDDSTHLWSIRTTSLSDNVTLKGTSTIDEETLKKIKGVATNIDDVNRSLLGVGGIVAHDRIYASVVFKPGKTWMFNLNYKLFTNENVPNESITNQLSFGAFYFIF